MRTDHVLNVWLHQPHQPFTKQEVLLTGDLLGQLKMGSGWVLWQEQWLDNITLMLPPASNCKMHCSIGP